MATSATSARAIGRLRAWLGQSIDGASLAMFRIFFGLLIAGSSVRFIAKGWVEELLLAPSYHFPYEGFEWVRPLSPGGLYACFVALAICGLCFAAGYRYRLSALACACLFTYLELLDKTLYLNHYYLLTLLLWWSCLMPLDRFFALHGREQALQPVPAWPLYLLRAQLCLVYFFAGVAKLRADWLFEAEPLATWLSTKAELFMVGPLLSTKASAYALSWLGAAFDLSIGPLLLFRRTRVVAYVLVVGFHLGTGVLFPIGVFPWAMIALTTVFFSPSWPRRFFSFLPTARLGKGGPTSRIVVVLLVIHMCLQVVLPLRAWAYPSDDAWRHEGFNFAWKVMLIEKVGLVRLRLRATRTGQSWTEEASAWHTPLQARTMATRPDMILQFAQRVQRHYEAKGVGPVEVYADAYASLNGRPSQRLIDPNVDLTRARWTFWTRAHWVLDESRPL